MESKLPSDEQRAKLEALEKAQFQDKPEQNPLPRGAVRVQPYLPNRKQRRAQAAAMRKGKTR